MIPDYVLSFVGDEVQLLLEDIVSQKQLIIFLLRLLGLELYGRYRLVKIVDPDDFSMLSSE